VPRVTLPLGTGWVDFSDLVIRHFEAATPPWARRSFVSLCEVTI
jgi:hypothetical protein